MHKSRAFTALTVVALAVSAVFAIISCSGGSSEERSVAAVEKYCEGETETAQAPAPAAGERIITHRENSAAVDRYAAASAATYERDARKESKSADWRARPGEDRRAPMRRPVLAEASKPQARLERFEPQEVPPQDAPTLDDAEAPDTLARSGGFRQFVETAEDHLSTFAIDVDTAAYALARKYIERGQLPPRDRVRVEEFVNYFKYYYKSPKEGAFAVYVEGAPSIFGQKGHKLLKIGLKTKEVKKEERKDALLIFVIDVSGSMRENGKLEQAKSALYCLIDQMREGDRIGIVTYNHVAQVLVKPCPAGTKDELVSEIRGLWPGGTTNAQAGLKLGYEIACKHFDPKCVNRIVFLSDGVANTGLTSAEEILKDVKTPDTCGIYLTTVGFGTDNYNDALLEKLADKGDGQYAHVDTLDEAKKVFVDELTGTLQVMAKDVKIQVDFDPEVVRRYRLLGYENRAVADSKFRDDSVDAGEAGAGHSVTALYEIELYDTLHEKLGTVHVRYKNPETGKATEVKQAFGSGDFTDSYHEASENFRLAALVAEFAEILRGSPYAAGSRLSAVYKLASQLAPEFDNRKDVMEFVSLAQRAAQLSGENLDDGCESLPAGAWYEPPDYPQRPGYAWREADTVRLLQVLVLTLAVAIMVMARVAYVYGFRWRRLPIKRNG
jgi:Ca-activated chloride channel family protein